MFFNNINIIHSSSLFNKLNTIINKGNDKCIVTARHVHDNK